MAISDAKSSADSGRHELDGGRIPQLFGPAVVTVAQNDAMAELLFALAGKSLLNGGTVRR